MISKLYAQILDLERIFFRVNLFVSFVEWTKWLGKRFVHFDERVRTGESRRASQNRARRGFELIKLKLCYLFIKWAIVSLDKTLIHRLESFKALWTVCSLYWKCLLDLEPFGPHWSPLYGEKSWNIFIKNLNFFSTEERKTWTSWMTWGWVNYQQKFFQKWTTPLI